MQRPAESTRDILALLALAVALSAPGIRDGYITDDFVHLARARDMSLHDAALAPDTFGFYRPVQQISYWVEARVFADGSWGYRFDNLALHLAVVALVFRLGLELVGTPRAGLIAALGFLLAPKTCTIAVTWISARCEILMALFALVAVLAWRRWIARGELRWLAAVAACYVLAILSKESAVALPAALAVVPSSAAAASRRVAAVVGLFALGAGVVAARMLNGALLPAEATAYNMLTPPRVWLRNTTNYLGRSVPAPAALLAVTLGGAALFDRAAVGAAARRTRSLLPLAVFAGAWFLVFIGPVLPVMPRSEVRVYATGIGFSLLTAALVGLLDASLRGRRAVTGALVLSAIAFGSYQAARTWEATKDLAFSTTFTQAIARDDAIRSHRGVVELHPATPEVASLVNDTVGGYFGVVLQDIFRRADIDGVVVGRPEGNDIAGARLAVVCDLVDGRVVLRRW